MNGYVIECKSYRYGKQVSRFLVAMVALLVVACAPKIAEEDRPAPNENGLCVPYFQIGPYSIEVVLQSKQSNPPRNDPTVASCSGEVSVRRGISERQGSFPVNGQDSLVIDYMTVTVDSQSIPIAFVTDSLRQSPQTDAGAFSIGTSNKRSFKLVKFELPIDTLPARLRLHATWIDPMNRRVLDSLTFRAKLFPPFPNAQVGTWMTNDACVPNPFSPTSIVTYSLSDSCHLVGLLFNVQGTIVDTIVNAVQGPGFYRINADRQGRLASGIYFYKLICGERTTTRKFLLLK
jgi:hypothetical protein